MNHDFDNPTYRDHFILSSGSEFDSLNDFIRRLATNQPPWLIRLSTGLKDKAAIEAALVSMAQTIPSNDAAQRRRNRLIHERDSALLVL